jgi:hypothetical protein
MKNIKFLMIIIFLLSFISIGNAQDISSGVVKVLRKTANYEYIVAYWSYIYDEQGLLLNGKDNLELLQMLM